MLDKTAATITINRPGEMNSRGRRAVATWIRKTAEDFERYGKDYTDKQFRARYLYQEDTNAKV